MAEPLRIALSGEGGQGIQSIAQILAEAAYSEGKEVLYIPNFGVEQRGGVSLAFVQINDKEIGSPKFTKGDLIIALSPRAVERTKQYVYQGTVLVYDSSLVAPPEIEDDVIGMQTYDTIAPDAFAERTGQKPKTGRVRLPRDVRRVVGVPATDVAQEELHPRVFNVIILGAVVELTGVVSVASIHKAMEDKFGSKFRQDPRLRDLNYAALERGRQLGGRGTVLLPPKEEPAFRE